MFDASNDLSREDLEPQVIRVQDYYTSETLPRVRLDVFLTEVIEGATRSKVLHWLEAHDIKRVNREDCPLKASQKIQSDDVFVFIPRPAIPATPLPVKMTLDILFEDAHLLVLNKPAGLVVHPACGHAQDTLVNGLLAHCSDWSGIGGVMRPGIVHRLDKDTSGVMVVAKHDQAHLGLAEQFSQKEQIKRIYLGFVKGVMIPSSGTIETFITRHPKDRQRMYAHPSLGKKATTQYTVLEIYHDQACMVQFRLLTGRTHQIRVHCLHKKHPMIGDPLYNPTPLTPLSFSRQALHAHLLEINHPITHHRMTFEAPLPDDLALLQKTLQNL